ncbi:MAG: pantoate--beta-alanine ligase [Bryobacteraceae bacterium]
MSAQLIPSILELRHALSDVRRAGRSIGLVPTMGALHAGHGRLIERARQQTDCVVVSIFVNPIQFNQRQDYDRYPRPLAEDLAFCSAGGVDIVFAPSVEEMYPSAQLAMVEVARVTEHLCGKSRPGHFRGVTTVVLKLLNIVQPDRAYFGEKDVQQLATIRRMAIDLDVPVEIVGVPTVREEDGLALSSRNRHLSPLERRIAPALYRALQAAGQLMASGTTDPQQIKTKALATLHPFPQIRVEYFEIVDPDEMQPVERIAGPVRVAVAAWLGTTRLIDNILCRVPSGSAGPFV